MSLARAVLASSSAYSLGREMTQMFASGRAVLAAPIVRYSTSASRLSPAVLPLAISLTFASAAWMTSSFSQSSERIRSLAPAFFTAGVIPPNSSTTVLFMSVAMTTTAFFTPGSFISSRDTDRIRMESI